jgi:hypothetical protein
MTNWGAAVPIMVAVIGISGVILPAFSTPLINQIYNKPSLSIDIGPVGPGKTMINLTNSGTMPATNLSLIVTVNNANKNISNITNLFSTVTVTLALPKSPNSTLAINQPSQISSRLVEIHVKKFVNGDGSIIRLLVDGKDTRYSDYTAYATYDQGSKKVIGGEKPLNPFILFFRDPFFPYYYGILFITYVIVFGYLVYKRRKRRYLDIITQEMMDVRKGLKDSLSNEKIYRVSNNGWPRRGVVIIALWWWLKPLYKDKRRIINDIKDYICIDDFYSKLAERNSYINDNVGNIDDIVLLKLNKKCLGLAEDALEKIDWSKYK